MTDPPTTSPPARQAAGKRPPSFRLGALIAAGLAIALVVWLGVSCGGSKSSTPSGSTATTPTSTAFAVSPKGLKTLATLLKRPIYWAGPIQGLTIAFRQLPDGRAFVRYLPHGVALDDPRAHFLLVGTYPVKNALAATKSAAAQAGGASARIAKGGFVYYNRSLPTNAYLAYPKSDWQVEVFDPSAGRALSLIVSGQIQPVG